jgi:hypothetical protein
LHLKFVGILFNVELVAKVQISPRWIYLIENQPFGKAIDIETNPLVCFQIEIGELIQLPLIELCSVFVEGDEVGKVGDFL